MYLSTRRFPRMVDPIKHREPTPISHTTVETHLENLKESERKTTIANDKSTKQTVACLAVQAKGSLSMCIFLYTTQHNKLHSTLHSTWHITLHTLREVHCPVFDGQASHLADLGFFDRVVVRGRVVDFVCGGHRCSSIGIAGRDSVCCCYHCSLQ